MGVTAMVLVLWLAQSGMEVTGDSTCPTPAEVQDQLAALAPATDGDATAKPPLHRVNISGAGPSVQVELLDLDGRLVADRTLERTGSCSDVAEAVAVILAAWEAKLNPNVATPVVRAPDAQPYQPVSSPVVESVKPQPSRPAAYDGGLAVLVSSAGGDAALGGRLEGCLFPAGRSLGLDVALSATATHTQSIATPASAAQWTRAALSAGPTYRLRRNALMLDLHAGPVLALLHVQGAGLSPAASDTSAQLGVQAGFRALWARSIAAGWLGVDVTTYPGQDRLTIGNYGEVGQLPHVDVQITFGLSLGRFH
jgi:hypothetical protein